VLVVLAAAGVTLGHAVASGQSPPEAAAVGVVATPVLGLPAPVGSSPAPSDPAPTPTKSSGHKAGPRRHRHGRPRSSPPPAGRHPRHPPLVVTDTGPPCYLQVERDGALLVRTILHGHQRMTFRHHGLDVVLGNAGAVRIARDGHPAVRAGRSGQVLRFRVQ
jgi:hypothetical protein